MQERLIFIKRVKDGIAASEKRSGRKISSLDKLSPELQDDIRQYIYNRRNMIPSKQKDLMDKYNISRNTLRKYIEHVLEREGADTI